MKPGSWVAGAQVNPLPSLGLDRSPLCLNQLGIQSPILRTVPSGRSFGGVTTSIFLKPHLRTWGKTTSPAATASRNPILPRKKPSGPSSDEAPWRAGPTGRPSDRLACRPVGIRCLRAEREREHRRCGRRPPSPPGPCRGPLLTCGPAQPRSRLPRR